ncbi:MAG: hypothetical protein ACT4QF_25000 [Sporichthyaceae bacterium]
MTKCMRFAVAVAVMFVAGCGSDSADTADSVPQAGSSVGPDEDDPRAREPGISSEEFYGWYRSDYVKNLDPATVDKIDRSAESASRPLFSRAFEDAADRADLVVSGTVVDLIFIPEGTVAKFRINGTGKGKAELSEIYFLQPSYVTPGEGGYGQRGNAVFIEDEVQPFLFEGDRAVLFLGDFTGAASLEQEEFIAETLGEVRMYYALRGAGQYRIENGKVRSEKASRWKPDREDRFDGKSEQAVLAATQERVAGRAEASPAP